MPRGRPMPLHKLSALLFALAVCPVMAQTSGMAAGPDLMRLDVVVEGRDHQPVAGLAQSSFAVLDNGVVQPMRSFRAVSGQAEPVKVLIVVDAVNVGYQRVAFERQQIDRFLKANDGKLEEPTGLAIFTDTGTQIQPGFSTDGNALSALLQKQVIGLRDLRGSSGFYGAAERLDLSLKTLSQLVSHARSQPGRKFIVWISPGWPLLSGPSLVLSSKDEQRLYGEVVALSTSLREADTTLYAVNPLGAAEDPGRTFYYETFLKGVRKPSEALPGNLGLQVLALQSGGLALSSSNDVSDMLRRCFADATAFYEIAYQPPPADAPQAYHTIEVRLTEPHLPARTRQSYYATP